MRIRSLRRLLGGRLPILLLLLLLLAGGPDPAAAQLRADEVPLEDLLSIVIVDREVMAFQARTGGRKRTRLLREENVLWKATRGNVAIVLTDQRVLAVATQSASWRERRWWRTETPPTGAVLGDRVALVLTGRRALAFDASTSRIVEYRIGPLERLRQTRVGDNTLVVLTNRLALGFSPRGGGFNSLEMQSGEKVEDVSAGSTMATITTDRRILVYKGTTGHWQIERRLLH